MNVTRDTWNKMESWKDIPDYEGHYQVSNTGRVKSFKKNKEAILKPWKDTRGYPQVYLCKGGKRKPISIHRLVLIAFVGLNKEKPTVNHKNGILDDNRLENLEWKTQLENNRHAFNTGLMDSIMGEQRSVSGLSNEEAIEICKLYFKGFTPKEISEKFNVKKYHIVNIIHGKSFRRVTAEVRNKMH